MTQPIPIRALPDYASVIEPALLNLSTNTRRAYATGMQQFLDWLGARPFTARSIKEWVDTLSTEHSGATINLRLAAVRRLAEYACEAGLIDEGAAGRIARLKGKARRGVRTGNWLTEAQAQAILDAIDRMTELGRRDAAIYALLFGCGLRVDEAARLEVGQVQERDGRVVLAELEGKHNRVRTVPVSPWAAGMLRDYLAAYDAPQGRLLRTEGGLSGISAQTVYRRVVAMGKAVGVVIASHDFRRTFGRLAVQAGADPKQVQMVYGHADERTTRGYLNLELDLANAPGDFIRVRT